MEPTPAPNQAASTPPAGRPTPAELRARQARNRRRTRGAFGRRPNPRKVSTYLEIPVNDEQLPPRS